MAAPGQRILPKAKALRLSSEFQAVSSLSMAEEEQLTLIPDTRESRRKAVVPYPRHSMVAKRDSRP